MDFRTLVAGSMVCALTGLAGPAADLTLDLGTSTGVTFVGATARWDERGLPLRSVDPKARIDVPAVTARAERGAGQKWVFRSLPPGRYDLVVIAGRVRVEGFHYPPIAEFDRVLAPTATAPADVREEIVNDIGKAKHYENKVAPLFLAGDEKQVRVFVQLVRDQPTTFDADFGQPAATIRHEVWQYVNRYGGWTKDRRTRVLDRHLLARRDLHGWTWAWEPALGGLFVQDKPVEMAYELPKSLDRRRLRGWLPSEP
jgi:hypothetical protein